MELTVDMFEQEIAEASCSFERYVICLDKTPDQFKESMRSLVEKAIKAYVNRNPSLRHGIALDRYNTVIISQTEGDRPLCGIYFNLSSPYKKAIERQK